MALEKALLELALLASTLHPATYNNTEFKLMPTAPFLVCRVAKL